MTTARTNWRKSSYSDNGAQCVEVFTAADHTRVRDTKNRAGAVLAFPAHAWAAFVGADRRA